VTSSLVTVPELTRRLPVDLSPLIFWIFARPLVTRFLTELRLETCFMGKVAGWARGLIGEAETTAAAAATTAR
jgi:hypothetical protein